MQTGLLGTATVTTQCFDLQVPIHPRFCPLLSSWAVGCRLSQSCQGQALQGAEGQVGSD